MLPGSRCSRCTQVMDQVADQAWVCIPCKRNVYWSGNLTEDARENYLQREFG